jgi:hypothetical protein
MRLILLNLPELTTMAHAQTMNSMYERNDTIPLTSRRIGSWQVSISRCVLPPGQLASRYDVIAADWERTAQRYQLETAY